MGDPLRDRRPLQDWAAENQVIEISGEIGSFDRLAEAVRADLAALEDDEPRPNLRDFAISGWMRFDGASADDGRLAVTGRIVGAVPAVCQRCMRPFRLPLAMDIRLELVGPGQASEAPVARQDGFDAWELSDTAVRPADILDEALVMAMPLVAKHEQKAECVEFDTAADGEKTTTPFASLRAQMDEADKD